MAAFPKGMAMKPQRKLFVLAGQSNIAGRGSILQLPEFPNRDRIFAYSYSGVWMPGADPVGHTLNGTPKSQFADRKAGAGPGMAFANRLAEKIPDVEIGLVPAAKGATFMDEWQPGFAGYYGGLLQRAREAAKAGEISGLIWYQGENDCIRVDFVAGWAEKFNAFVGAVRADLNCPTLPVIMTVLGPNRAPWRYPYWDSFVAMQQAMALPSGAVKVSANDLEGIRDDPHLTTQDYVRLGERYGDAMADLISAT